MLLGRIDLDDFNEIMGSNIPKDETDTLSGYIYKRLGRVPVNGTSIQIGHVLLTVEEVVGKRIRKVRAKLVAQPLDEEEEKADDNG
jgi:CBS domain containing-hemolysin-like protein